MRAQRLLTLCVAAYLLHGATMAGLPQMQNPEVPALVAPDDETKEFYMHEGKIECKKCPAGTYVHAPCKEPRTEGTCERCENGTFAKKLNSFGRCFTCRVCRTLDEVEIKKCTATTGSECACKKGTFCSPTEPCETCHKCTPSCRPGEQKVQDCTPTSDIQCLPVTTSSPPTEYFVWILPCLLILLAVGLAVCYKKNASCRNACTSFWSPRITQFLQQLRKSSSQDQSEEHDNMLNRYRDQQTKPHLLDCTCTPARSEASEAVSLSIVSPSGKEVQKSSEGRKLVPTNGKNSADALSRSFDIFIKKVPLKEWKRFMRALDLTDNEISFAEQCGKYVNEQQYQMLRTWLDKNGRAASLDVLLGVLYSMDFRGIVEEIKSTLIADYLYVYEE